MPEVSSLLVCAYPVACHIDYVIQWCIEFPLCCVVYPTRFFHPFSPPPSSAYGSFFTGIFQCDGCLFIFFCVGVHGWVALSCQPWGHYFKLGWKPLDIPGTQPPFSDAFVNGKIRWIIVGYIQVARHPNLDLFVEGLAKSKEEFVS